MVYGMAEDDEGGDGGCARGEGEGGGHVAVAGVVLARGADDDGGEDHALQPHCGVSVRVRKMREAGEATREGMAGWRDGGRGRGTYAV